MRKMLVTVADPDGFDAAGNKILKDNGFEWNGTEWIKFPALDESDRFQLVKQLRRADCADKFQLRNKERDLF